MRFLDLSPCATLFFQRQIGLITWDREEKKERNGCGIGEERGPASLDCGRGDGEMEKEDVFGYVGWVPPPIPSPSKQSRIYLQPAEGN